MSRRGKRLGARSKRLRLGRSTLVVVHLNKRGRGLLKRSLRRHKRIALKVRVRLPGSGPITRRVRLRP